MSRKLEVENLGKLAGSHRRRVRALADKQVGLRERHLGARILE